MLENLVGTWKVIACQLNERWLPESIFREFRYSFTKNDEYFIQWAELSYPQFVGGFPKSNIGKVTTDTSTNPYSIDILPAAGPFAEQTFAGIFELERDIFKGNFAFPDRPRPTAFTAQQGEVYEVWQRV